MSWIKRKSESLLIHVSFENKDSTVHHLIRWAVAFPEKIVGAENSYKCIIPQGNKCRLWVVHSLYYSKSITLETTITYSTNLTARLQPSSINYLRDLSPYVSESLKQIKTPSSRATRCREQVFTIQTYIYLQGPLRLTALVGGTHTPYTFLPIKWRPPYGPIKLVRDTPLTIILSFSFFLEMTNRVLYRVANTIVEVISKRVSSRHTSCPFAFLKTLQEW